MCRHILPLNKPVQAKIKPKKDLFDFGSYVVPLHVSNQSRHGCHAFMLVQLIHLQIHHCILGGVRLLRLLHVQTQRQNPSWHQKHQITSEASSNR